MNFANTPSFANQGLQPGGRLFLCVLTSLALLIGDSQYGLMEKARDAISVVLYPLQRAANVPLNLTMQVGDFFTAQAALKRENDALRERDLIQSSHLMRMSSLEKELQQLRQLNALAAQPSHAGVVAEVNSKLGEYMTPSPPGVAMPPVIDLIDDRQYLSSQQPIVPRPQSSA